VLKGTGCDPETGGENGEGDGPDRCVYEWLAELTPEEGKQAGSDGRDPESIDGTYLVVEGERYHVVSAKDSDGEAALQISRLDTESWKVEGWTVIARANRKWERDEVPLLEGPHVCFVHFCASLPSTPYSFLIPLRLDARLSECICFQIPHLPSSRHENGND